MFFATIAALKTNSTLPLHMGAWLAGLLALSLEHSRAQMDERALRERLDGPAGPLPGVPSGALLGVSWAVLALFLAGVFLTSVANQHSIVHDVISDAWLLLPTLLGQFSVGLSGAFLATLSLWVVGVRIKRLKRHAKGVRLRATPRTVALASFFYFLTLLVRASGLDALILGGTLKGLLALVMAISTAAPDNTSPPRWEAPDAPEIPSAVPSAVLRYLAQGEEPAAPETLLVALKEGRTGADVESFQVAGVEEQVLAVGEGRHYKVRSDQLGLVNRIMLQMDEDVAEVRINPVLSLVPAADSGERCGSGGLSVGGFNDPLAPGQRDLQAMGDLSEIYRLLRNAPREGHRNPREGMVLLIDDGVKRHSDLPLGTALDLDRMALSTVAKHGTQMAGVIGAQADNGTGIASFNLGYRIGIKNKALFAEGKPTASDLAETIADTMKPNFGKVHVINLSFNERGTAPAVIAKAIAEAQRQGAVVVAAAGNENRRSAADYWPANLPGVVAVGASDGERPARFSNKVQTLPYGIWAPGVEVCTTNNENGYSKASGSSIAAARVSGLLAAGASFCPSLITGEDLRTALMDSAKNTDHGRMARADTFFRLVEGRCEDLKQQ